MTILHRIFGRRPPTPAPLATVGLRQLYREAYRRLLDYETRSGLNPYEQVQLAAARRHLQDSWDQVQRWHAGADVLVSDDLRSA